MGHFWRVRGSAVICTNSPPRSNRSCGAPDQQRPALAASGCLGAYARLTMRNNVGGKRRSQAIEAGSCHGRRLSSSVDGLLQRRASVLAS